MYQPEQELSLQNAVKSVQAGLAAIAQGQTDFDLSTLTIVDSSAVGAMLEWQRAASLQGKSITFHHVPASINSLMALYGVGDVLTMAPAGRH
jgi:phospholipid transport system transporter-binding protein